MAPSLPVRIQPGLAGLPPSRAGRGLDAQSLRQRLVIAREQVLAARLHPHSERFNQWWLEWSCCLSDLAALEAARRWGHDFE